MIAYVPPGNPSDDIDTFVLPNGNLGALVSVNYNPDGHRFTYASTDVTDRLTREQKEYLAGPDFDTPPGAVDKGQITFDVASQRFYFDGDDVTDTLSRAQRIAIGGEDFDLDRYDKEQAALPAPPARPGLFTGITTPTLPAITLPVRAAPADEDTFPPILWGLGLAFLAALYLRSTKP